MVSNVGTEEESEGIGMSRCPLCGGKDCCGGYYQEVQDVLVETLGIVLSLMDESSGVVGYHLNGEVATWEELALREELEAVVRKARGEE